MLLLNPFGLIKNIERKIKEVFKLVSRKNFASLETVR